MFMCIFLLCHQFCQSKLQIGKRLAIAASLIFLSACGGGGGGSSPTSQGPLPPSTGAPTQTNTDFSSTYPKYPESYYLTHREYNGQVGLSVIQASKAYSKGLTGNRVTIGFTDTGLDESHYEFQDKNIILNDRTAYGSVTPTNYQLSHGTSVASIATGHFGNGGGIHGVAFGADLAMYSLKLKADDTLEITDAIFNTGLNRLEAVQSNIVNHSWGLSIQYDPFHYGSQKRMLDIEYGNAVRTMSNSQAIHVWSTGNEGGDQVSATAALPLYYPALRNKTLIVVAVDSDGLIGRDSDKCGGAKAFCLAAPGGYNYGTELVRAADAGAGYRGVVGTSFAAPHVAGVLALMKELFGDQLTNAEYIQRLLLTANKTGIYADSDIYGHGLLNAGAATNPVGPSSVKTPGQTIPLDESGFNLNVLGHVVADYMENKRIIIHDSLDAPFPVSLGAFSTSPTPANEAIHQSAESLVVAHVPTPQMTGHFSFADNTFDISTYNDVPVYQLTSLTPLHGHGQPQSTVMRAPYLANLPVAMGTQLKSGRLSFSSFWGHQEDAADKTQNDNLQHTLGLIGNWGQQYGRVTLGVQTGLIMEEKALFGATGQGAFALDGFGQSLYVGVGGEIALPNGWSSGIGIYSGQSDIQGASNSLVGSISDVKSMAYEAVLWKQFDGWQIYSRIAQPLRIEAGKLNLNLLVTRIAGGGIIVEKESVSLKTSGQEMQLTFGGQFYTENSIWGLDLQIRHEPDHNPDSQTIISLGGAWRLQF